jgi:hypothetical protein
MPSDAVDADGEAEHVDETTGAADAVGSFEIQVVANTAVRRFGVVRRPRRARVLLGVRVEPPERG